MSKSPGRNESERRGSPECPGPEALGAATLAPAVSGRDAPAGPQWVSGLSPLPPSSLAYDKPLCASLDGFTLHAATRAGAWDEAGREALLCTILRPPIGQERLEQREDGLVRITLKKPYSDGTVAVDMDPLSLLTRLVTSVPPPRFHTVRYSGVLAAASGVRSLITPEALGEESEGKGHGQRLPPVGGVAAPHVCRGGAHLSFLPRAHEAAGGDPGSGAGRPVPRRGRGGDGGAPPLPGSWSAVLEEPGSPPAGARPGEGLRQQDRRDGRDRIATARTLAAGRRVPARHAKRCLPNAGGAYPRTASAGPLASERAADGKTTVRARTVIEGRSSPVLVPTLPLPADQRVQPDSARE